MSNLSDTIILVVDDDREYREIHQRRLEPTGARLYIAGSQGEARHLIERQFFHAAVLDIRLVDRQAENVEGLELAKALFELGESTGIVIVSGYGTPERVREAFRKYHAVDFLEKATYTPQMFVTALEDAASAAHAYVASLRSRTTAEALVDHVTLMSAQRDLNPTGQQSLQRVFQVLMKPLAPLLTTPQFVQVDANGTLHLRCWSRYQGAGYALRFGQRRQIREELDAFRQTGMREDELYTIGGVSGFRTVDSSLTPGDFAM